MDIYLGMIVQTGFSFSVRSWALCQGQIAQISQNTALFSLLGTYYGGDGRVTYGFPDLRGRTPIGYGLGPGLTNRIIGSKGGIETTTLTASNLPSHTHSHSYSGSGGGTTIPVQTEVSATKQDGTQSAPESGAYLAASKEVGQGGSDFMYIPAADVDHTQLVNLGGVTSTAIGGGSFDNNAFVISNTGSNTSFANMQPFQVTNYQIATLGTYPSRN
ncbi:phage tail protein [Campylobacterota bacterium DY0563]